MDKEEMLKRLRDLIADRKSFIGNDKEINEVFEEDIKALEYAINYINQLETNRDILKEYIQDLRYNIEPEGVRINFNCEYDSEEDYVSGMEEQAKLEILKAILSKMQELERGKENE